MSAEHNNIHELTKDELERLREKLKGLAGRKKEFSQAIRKVFRVTQEAMNTPFNV